MVDPNVRRDIGGWISGPCLDPIGDGADELTPRIQAGSDLDRAIDAFVAADDDDEEELVHLADNIAAEKLFLAEQN